MPHHAPLDDPQTATLRLKLGHRGTATGRVRITPAGLLAIGTLTAMVLLAVAPLVLAAGKARAEGE